MQLLVDWLAGDLGSQGRVLAAILPAILLGSYFLGGLLIYAARTLRHGRYRDAEIEARGSSFLIGPAARAYFAWVMKPIWSGLVKLEVPPNAITTLSVLLAAGGGMALAVGRFSLGGWLYLFAGACDFVDGRLARASGRASSAGAALDSVLDRYAESVIFMGLAWFYRESWVMVAVMAAMLGSQMVSYVRARGEGLGVDVKVGLMQRPERLVILGAALAFSPVVEVMLVPDDPRPIHRLAVAAIVFLAVSANITALRRLVHVIAALQPESMNHWKKPAGRGGVVRNIVAAIVATGTDLGVVVLALRAGSEPWLATIFGCLVGGVVNFMINRVWTFGSKAPPLGQATRYTFVSASSALLNAGGVTILLLLPGMVPLLAWVIARAVVFMTWNYPLHREYVYAPTSLPPPAADADVSPSAA